MSVSRKGFSMVEMLLCLVIISVLMLLTISNTSVINLSHYYFLNDYLKAQSQAILNKENQILEYGVKINSMGRVNQARTIEFANHKVIIHLGNGYATYE